MSSNTPELTIHKADTSTELQLPLMGNTISAGFPSPADDFIDQAIDLNKELIKNPSATFLGRVKGVSMIDAGIYPEDILIVDKSLDVRSGDIVVSFINNEFTLKRILIEKKQIWLLPENKDYHPILVTEENEFLIWGIVTYIIKKARR